MIQNGRWCVPHISGLVSLPSPPAVPVCRPRAQPQPRRRTRAASCRAVPGSRRPRQSHRHPGRLRPGTVRLAALRPPHAGRPQSRESRQPLPATRAASVPARCASPRSGRRAPAALSHASPVSPTRHPGRLRPGTVRLAALRPPRSGRPQSRESRQPHPPPGPGNSVEIPASGERRVPGSSPDAPRKPDIPCYLGHQRPPRGPVGLTRLPGTPRGADRPEIGPARVGRPRIRRA
jgi:hypothetical protein